MGKRPNTAPGMTESSLVEKPRPQLAPASDERDEPRDVWLADTILHYRGPGGKGAVSLHDMPTPMLDALRARLAEQEGAPSQDVEPVAVWLAMESGVEHGFCRGVFASKADAVGWLQDLHGASREPVGAIQQEGDTLWFENDLEDRVSVRRWPIAGAASPPDAQNLVEALEKIANEQGWLHDGRVDGAYVVCDVCGVDRREADHSDECVYEIARAALTSYTSEERDA